MTRLNAAAFGYAGTIVSALIMLLLGILINAGMYLGGANRVGSPSIVFSREKVVPPAKGYGVLAVEESQEDPCRAGFFSLR